MRRLIRRILQSLALVAILLSIAPPSIPNTSADHLVPLGYRLPFNNYEDGQQIFITTAAGHGPTHVCASNCATFWALDYATHWSDSDDVKRFRVRAPAAGVIRYMQDAGSSCSYQCGLTIQIEHYDGYWSRMLHLASFEPGLGPGSFVAQGQPLGRAGDTGAAVGIHLHYEVRSSMTTGTCCTGQSIWHALQIPGSWFYQCYVPPQVQQDGLAQACGGFPGYQGVAEYLVRGQPAWAEQFARHLRASPGSPTNHPVFYPSFRDVPSGEIRWHRGWNPTNPQFVTYRFNEITGWWDVLGPDWPASGNAMMRQDGFDTALAALAYINGQWSTFSSINAVPASGGSYGRPPLAVSYSASDTTVVLSFSDTRYHFHEVQRSVCRGDGPGCIQETWSGATSTLPWIRGYFYRVRALSDNWSEWSWWVVAPTP